MTATWKVRRLVCQRAYSFPQCSVTPSMVWPTAAEPLEVGGICSPGGACFVSSASASLPMRSVGSAAFSGDARSVPTAALAPTPPFNPSSARASLSSSSDTGIARGPCSCGGNASHIP